MAYKAVIQLNEKESDKLCMLHLIPFLHTYVCKLNYIACMHH